MSMNYKLPHDPCEICECLVRLTQNVGIDEITDENWREFWVRLHMLGAHILTPRQVREHVGLQTNVVPMTKAQFKERMVKNQRWSAEKSLKKKLEAESGS
jgi:hypothetical protein